MFFVRPTYAFLFTALIAEAFDAVVADAHDVADESQVYGGAPVCQVCEVCDCAHGGEHGDSRHSLFNVCMVIVCLFAASAASGLSVGCACMDQYELTVLVQAHEDDCPSVEEKKTLVEQRRIANLILPVLKDRNRLLVTFVLLSAVSNEALPLFLGELFPEWVACLVSVTLVVFIGEILPCAMFRGPRQMEIAASMVPFINFLVFVLAPAARPVAYVLDLFLEDTESSTNVKYTRAQMNAMLNMHVVGATQEDENVEMSSQPNLPRCQSGLAKREVHAIRTIISSRVVWKTMYKAPLLKADVIFRGFGGMAPRNNLLVQDDKQLIGWISAAALSTAHAKHGDRPIRSFELNQLVFIDTSTEDPALFEVLCAMIKADSNFVICGSADNPEGFITLKSIVAQLVCDNERASRSHSAQSATAVQPLFVRRRTRSLSCAGYPMQSQLQQFVAQQETGVKITARRRTMSDHAANELEGNNDSEDEDEDEDDDEGENEDTFKEIADEIEMSSAVRDRHFLRRGHTFSNFN
eukprot:GEMP01016005.1.p1 GENE.GEMP01016005.1~~GEMP01016005.1.p1  ORF type:complete len:524 (+),score=115.56 GEMP01016005.1:136-1707(+)